MRLLGYKMEQYNTLRTYLEVLPMVYLWLISDLPKLDFLHLTYAMVEEIVGTARDDIPTMALYSSRSSTSLTISWDFIPVHTMVLSSLLFLCPPALSDWPAYLWLFPGCYYSLYSRLSQRLFPFHILFMLYQVFHQVFMFSSDPASP